MFSGWKKQVFNVYWHITGQQFAPIDNDLLATLKNMYQTGLTPEQAADSLAVYTTSDGDPFAATLKMADFLVDKEKQQVSQMINVPGSKEFIRAVIKSYFIARNGGRTHVESLSEMIDASGLSSKKTTLLKSLEEYRDPSLPRERPSSEMEIKWFVSELFRMKYGRAQGNLYSTWLDMLWEIIDSSFSDLSDYNYHSCSSFPEVDSRP